MIRKSRALFIPFFLFFFPCRSKWECGLNRMDINLVIHFYDRYCAHLLQRLITANIQRRHLKYYEYDDCGSRNFFNRSWHTLSHKFGILFGVLFLHWKFYHFLFVHIIHLPFFVLFFPFFFSFFLIIFFRFFIIYLFLSKYLFLLPFRNIFYTFFFFHSAYVKRIGTLTCQVPKLVLAFSIMNAIQTSIYVPHTCTIPVHTNTSVDIYIFCPINF